MPKFSELITATRIYENSVDYYGIADVTMPNIKQLTETMEGAGVAGQYDAIIKGHIEAMKMTINFRNPTKDAVKLFTPVEHQLDIRSSIQERDTVTGAKDLAEKIVVKATPINLDMGKRANYSKSDTASEFTVTYFAQYLDGEKVIEIDPMNYIFFVDGVDYLEPVRRNLGLA